MTVGRHVDAETLAAFREDLLPRRRARRVAAHLEGCARCGELDARLADVTSVLASTPAPPMPAGLAARIEAALAAEAAATAQDAGASTTGGAADGRPGRLAEPGTAGVIAPDAATPGPGAHTPNPITSRPATPESVTRGAATPGTQGPGIPRADTPGTATPVPATRGPRGPGGAGPGRGVPGRQPQARPSRARPPRHRSGHGSRLALRVAAAAAVVVVLGGGGYGLVRLLSSSPAHPTAGAAAPLLAPRENGNRAAAGSGAHLARPAPSAVIGFPVVASGTNYQPGRLASQVSAVITRVGRQRIPARRFLEGHAPPAFGGMRNLPACVTRVSGGREPKLVDLARYRGRPAAVIVVPAGGRLLHVWVVTRDCSGITSGILAQLTLPTAG